MRYGHDRKPRNPYNKIIQENLAPAGLDSIISHYAPTIQ